MYRPQLECVPMTRIVSFLKIKNLATTKEMLGALDKELDQFFAMWDKPTPPQPPPERVTVSHDGYLWDGETGEAVGRVYVPGYVQTSRRTYSRYSRRARFFCRVIDYYGTNDDKAVRIMKVFNVVLKQWNLTKDIYPRIYFLNVRCLIYFIAEYLGLAPPFHKSECLRDAKRFTVQKKMFDTFVCNL